MPLALLLIGGILVITAVKGTWNDLFNVVKGDFQGQNNFLYWLVAIVGIGLLGFVKPIRPISDAFLVLVVVVLFLSHKGFFQKFQEAIKQRG